jgi:hypothetical protein
MVATKRHLAVVAQPALQSGMPTAEALASFLRHLANRRGRSGRITSPETVRSNTSALLAAFAGITDLGELAGSGRDRLLANIRAVWGGKAPSTFNAKRAAVGSALAYFHDQDWSGDPAVVLAGRPAVRRWRTHRRRGPGPAATLRELGETPAPGGRAWFSPAARRGFAHPAMPGETFVHTDLNPANLIVSPDGLRVVDWAFATRAAPWVELALLVQWLIGSGHAPEVAEEWMARCPTWGATNPEVLDAVRVEERREVVAQGTAEHCAVGDLSAWTGEWSAYRRTEALKQTISRPGS